MIENRDDLSTESSAFAERIAGPLRRPERLDPSFDDRLMRRVEIEAPELYARSRPNTARWWKTERVIRLSPLGAVALAAGISMFVAISTLAVGTRAWKHGATPDVTASVRSAAIRSDTVNLVRFVFVDSNARRVELVGDFNEWAKGTTQLKPSGAPGVWTVSVPLSPGRHEYAFIINGSRWVADPLAVKSSDDFGTESSVIRVGASAKSTT
jgi:hypothetical protein